MTVTVNVHMSGTYADMDAAIAAVKDLPAWGMRRAVTLTGIQVEAPAVALMEAPVAAPAAVPAEDNPEAGVELPTAQDLKALANQYFAKGGTRASLSELIAKHGGVSISTVPQASLIPFRNELQALING